MENYPNRKMLQVIISLLCILIVGLGFLIFKTLSIESHFASGQAPLRAVSLYSPNDYLGKSAGDGYKNNYDRLSRRPLEPDSIRGFFIDSAGFKRLMDSTGFKGFYIALGCRDPSKPNEIELLFAGVKGDSTTYLTDDLKGQKSYLDKIAPCPGPNCPVKP